MANIDLQPVSLPPRAGGVLGKVSGRAVPAGEALPGEKPFGQVLTDVLSTTNDLAIQSNQKNQEFLTGQSRNVHETMIAMEKAGIAFRFVAQVRNKAIEAYREIIRMQM